jgi:acyl-CoA synthetase (AMP-forming)/AMP-acid ligase II
MIASKGPEAALRWSHYQKTSEPSTPRTSAPRTVPQKSRQIVERVIDEITSTDMLTFPTMTALLRFRAASTPKANALISFDQKGRELLSITYEKLFSKAERIANLTQNVKKPPQKGDRVILLYRRTEIVDYAAALIACFNAGFIAVPIVSDPLSDELKDILLLIQKTGARLVMTTDQNVKYINKDAATRKIEWPAGLEWWKTNGKFDSSHGRISGLLTNENIDVGTHVSKKKSTEDAVEILPTDVAYIDFSRSIIGELKGVVFTHASIMSQCRAAKVGNRVTNKDVILTSTEGRQQVGLILGQMLPLYCGSTGLLLPMSATEGSGVWVNIATKYSGKGF